MVSLIKKKLACKVDDRQLFHQTVHYTYKNIIIKISFTNAVVNSVIIPAAEAHGNVWKLPLYSRKHIGCSDIINAWEE